MREESIQSIEMAWDEFIGEVKQYQPKGELKAWCNSFICNGNQKSIFFAYGQEKKVPKTEIFCPQCGSALYWARSDNRSSKRNRNHQRKKYCRITEE